MIDSKGIVHLTVPKPFEPLLRSKYRYKFYHGGRGGGKSYAFADCLIVLAASRPKLFIACVREVQNSIKNSVYKLLKDRIAALGLSGVFDFYEDKIVCNLTKSTFIFMGLKEQNKQNIKSLEGVDYCWIEEGQTISAGSWEILDPTIRKDGSEIWISMNREEENDPLWLALGANPDDRTLVKKINYYDNPYCPEELKLQAAKCKEEDFDSYLHIWEGEPLPQGTLKLISSRDVHRALEFKVDNNNNQLPLIVGVDVARFGDDRTAICFRRGRQAFGMKTYKHFDTVQVANVLTSIILEKNPARIYIDAGANGAGVVDLLRHRGYGRIVEGINFGGEAQDSSIYGNRRAEMWDRINQWLKDPSGVALTDMGDILTDLTAPNKKYDVRSRLFLEKKDEIKKRLGFSPDLGDALALTFAELAYPADVNSAQVQFVDSNVYFDNFGGSGFVDSNVYFD